MGHGYRRNDREKMISIKYVSSYVHTYVSTNKIIIIIIIIIIIVFKKSVKHKTFSIRNEKYGLHLLQILDSLIVTISFEP